MRQLIVRKVEETVVRKLKQQAGAHGVSMEEEHRRILRQSLLGKRMPKPSFKDFLRQMPALEPAGLFERDRDTGRKVVL